MPNFRKLEPEEVQSLQNKGKGTRKLTEEQYDAFLADYEVGEFGEATLDEGENRLTVRNRMKAAATRRGIGINFRRTSGDLIRFEIVEQGGDGEISNKSNRSFPIAVAQEANAVSSEAPPKNKGGRPKKQEKGTMERLGEIAGKVQDAATGALEDIGLREPANRKGGRPKKNPAA
jgi:hypothetical protein